MISYTIYMKKYHIFLFVAFLLVWIWAAINPVFPHDWLLENYLVFLAVPLRYFKLSDTSYTLITIFLILHVIGSHYTYAEVPLGYTLKDFFDADRNMYDRIVHFSFGLLLFYPMREVFIRIARVRGFWGYFFPIDLVGSGSAMYEILEWFIARNVDPAAGLSFLGSQGDIWDAQKDMALAISGAIVTAIIVFCINMKYKKDFWLDIKSSFTIPKDDHPLGEVELQNMRK